MTKIEQAAAYQRKNYWTLDIAKFICAILIISAHFASEIATFPTLIDYVFSVYIIAVPFFFCCSGFLFFKKLNALEEAAEKRKYFWSYQKRIWIMYGVWSLIYMTFVVATWIRKGICTWAQFLKWLHMAVVSQTYATIWFLPALAVGIALTYLLVTKVKNKWGCIAICIGLYVIGSLGYSYNFICKDTFVGKIYEWYLIAFKTTRNGLFNAVPFLYMGYLFATRKDTNEYRQQVWKDVVLMAACFALVVAESFFLKLNFDVTGMDFIFALLPFTYFLMKTLLGIDLKERGVYVYCRKLSLLMFVSQRLFLSVFSVVFPSLFGVLYKNSYVGLFIVLVLTIGFSLVVVLLSKKVKSLKWIM